MRDLDLYDSNNHNKSDLTYKLKTVDFEFVGLDQPQKKRGTKRKILWVNEANEITLEDWTQLIIRTEGEVFLDFNPSDEFHFLYDNVLTREDCIFIQSTYKDNPFLAKPIVDEIERLQQQNENSWRVFGLGERGVSEEVIYSNWQTFTEYPQKIDEVIYGLDFGFNNPTALVEISLADTLPYIRERIHESKLTNADLIRELDKLGIDKSYTIYADNAEPARIEEISRAGYRIVPADKSVEDGIDYLKSLVLYIHGESSNGLKELRSYKYKVDKNGVVLDEPVKFHDHFCDAMRYGIYTHYLRSGYAKPNIRGVG